MKYNGHSLRHEQKYLINYAQYNSIANVLSSFMEHDKNSGERGYFIRSLYFDDIKNAAYEDKMAGVMRRRKHRIRIYNCESKVIKFEIKDKFDNYISKISAPISYDECMGMIYGDFDFMLTSPYPALRAGFVDARLRQLSPAVVVDYMREAFVGEEGNVRVTFDRALRAGFASFDIFDPELPTLPAIDDGTLVLEVKYDDFLPNSVKKLLAPLDSRQTSLSKYVMCRTAQNTYYRKGMPYGSY